MADCAGAASNETCDFGYAQQGNRFGTRNTRNHRKGSPQSGDAQNESYISCRAMQDGRKTDHGLTRNRAFSRWRAAGSMVFRGSFLIIPPYRSCYPAAQLRWLKFSIKLK